MRTVAKLVAATPGAMVTAPLRSSVLCHNAKATDSQAVLDSRGKSCDIGATSEFFGVELIQSQLIQTPVRSLDCLQLFEHSENFWSGCGGDGATQHFERRQSTVLQPAWFGLYVKLVLSTWPCRAHCKFGECLSSRGTSSNFAELP